MGTVARKHRPTPRPDVLSPLPPSEKLKALVTQGTLPAKRGKGAIEPSTNASNTKKGRELEAQTKRVQQQRKQKTFLRAYVKAGTIQAGALAARVNRASHYEWLSNDEEYARAFEAAKEEQIETLELECKRRALARSDILLIFLMKAGRPNVYRDRWEGKLDTTSIVAPMTPAMLKHMSSGELEQARALFRKMLGQGDEG